MWCIWCYLKKSCSTYMGRARVCAPQGLQPAQESQTRAWMNKALLILASQLGNWSLVRWSDLPVVVWEVGRLDTELGSQGIWVQNQFLSVTPDKPGDFSVTCCFALGIPQQKNQQVSISTENRCSTATACDWEMLGLFKKKNKIHTSFRHCLLPFLDNL